MVTVISAESTHFYARTALMYVYMGHMRFNDTKPYHDTYWERNNIQLVKDRITKIAFEQKTLYGQSGKTYTYDQLIIATGSTSNTLNIEGEQLEGVTGFYNLQDLEYIKAKSTPGRKVVIVGGGLIGIELAEMFHSRNIQVTHLVREDRYGASVLSEEESALIEQHILDHNIDLRFKTEVHKINGTGEGKVKSVTTQQGEEIDCDLVCVAIGVTPNVRWIIESELDINRGILVNTFLQTNIPDVFAIGDCAELKDPGSGRKSIEPIWYTGRMMGETVAQTICRQKTKYDPGIWFYSAKFFAIEYQCYGDISPKHAKDQKTLSWQDKRQGKSFQMHYTDSGVTGFSTLGIRLRQDVCEKWIRIQCSVEHVLEDLELAFFDPEFSASYGNNIREVYRHLTGIHLRQKRKKGYNSVYRFLKYPNALTR